jgi:hypothetical protein
MRSKIANPGNVDLDIPISIIHSYTFQDCIKLTKVYLAT